MWEGGCGHDGVKGGNGTTVIAYLIKYIFNKWLFILVSLHSDKTSGFLLDKCSAYFIHFYSCNHWTFSSGLNHLLRSINVVGWHSVPCSLSWSWILLAPFPHDFVIFFFLMDQLTSHSQRLNPFFSSNLRIHSFSTHMHMQAHLFCEHYCLFI